VDTVVLLHVVVEDLVVEMVDVDVLALLVSVLNSNRLLLKYVVWLVLWPEVVVSHSALRLLSVTRRDVLV